MNTSKIDCQDRIQQSNGLTSDLALHSSQFFGNQQNWNMGIRPQPSVMEAGLQQQELRHDKSSTSIMSRFESPALAFYATEICMGFPQYNCQVGGGGAPLCCPNKSNSYDLQFLSHRSSGENYVSGEQADGNSELRNSLQSMVKSHLSDDHYYKSYKSACSSSFLHQLERNKLSSNGTASTVSHFSVPFQGDQDHRIGYNLCSSPFAQLGFSSQKEMQSLRFSSAGASLSCVNPVANGAAALSSKTRIRWTQDLHKKFVECVNRRGGAEKATPKAIWKLMETDGLTIFHVKSHLQKYRIAKYMPDSSEGKAEKRTTINDVSQIEMKTGLQIKEALQLQLDVQRRLHEQLEIQKNLQLRIEEQGRQLKLMFDQQQRTSNSLFKNQNLDGTSPDEPEFSPEDVEASIAECSNNTHFPSKIS